MPIKIEQLSLNWRKYVIQLDYPLIKQFAVVALHKDSIFFWSVFSHQQGLLPYESGPAQGIFLLKKSSSLPLLLDWGSGPFWKAPTDQL